MANTFLRAFLVSALASLSICLSGCGSNTPEEVQWPFSSLESLVFESDSVSSFSDVNITVETSTKFWSENISDRMRFEQKQTSIGGLTTLNSEIANHTVLTQLTGSFDDQSCFYNEINSSAPSGAAATSLSALFPWAFDALPKYTGVEDCPGDESRTCDKWHAVGNGTQGKAKVHKTYWIQTKSANLVQAETEVKDGTGAQTVKWVFSKWEVNGTLPQGIFTVPKSWLPCKNSAGLAEVEEEEEEDEEEGEEDEEEDEEEEDVGSDVEQALV